MSVIEDHTFVVPAYGRSRHLEDCLASLRTQSSGSRVVVSTSTPFEGIETLAKEYGAEIFVHSPNRGIGHDWNMALEQSRTTWTTLAHQDDVYYREYSARVCDAGGNSEDTLIVFSDYVEVRQNGKCSVGPLLMLKRLLLHGGFLGRNTIASRGAKMRALRLGSSIPCPAVTYHRRAIESFRFREDLRVSLDWAAWLDLATRRGAFVWVRDVLMEHRIHPVSETRRALDDGSRRREDLDLLQMLWPRPVAKLLSAAFSVAYGEER